MEFELVNDMTFEEIESHPLFLSNHDLYQFVNGYTDYTTVDNVFLFFILLCSRRFDNLENENIEELTYVIKERLDKLLEICDPDTSVLHSMCDYIGPLLTNFLISYFWESINRDIIIDGIMESLIDDFDETNKENKEILESILLEHINDGELMIFVGLHENWKSMHNVLYEAAESNDEIRQLLEDECGIYFE